MTKRKRNSRLHSREAKRDKLPTKFSRGKKIPDLVFLLFYFVLVVLLFKRFIFANKMLFGTDTIAAGVMFRTFYANFVRHFHSLPLWEPYLFGGMPFVDAMHGDT